jgi:guanyl-specific ribonuclease Sa
MKTVRLILLVVFGLFVLYVKYAAPPAVVSDSTRASADSSNVDKSVPAKAVQVLQIVRSTGQPPDGYVGGRVFQNREGLLPAGGDYREFDLDPHHGGRNAERIIVEWSTKKAWYTGDHYQTFVPMR